MTEAEAHEYFLNNHELAPSKPKYAVNTTFDMDIGSMVIILAGPFTGKRGVISNMTAHRPSSSLYSNHHIYRVVEPNTRAYVGDFREHEIARIDPSVYEVGEHAVVFSSYNPWKIANWVPVWNGYYHKVEIVSVGFNPKLPHKKLYKVRRVNRKLEFNASGLNMRKIKSPQPFDPSDVDLSGLLISPEILRE